MELTPLKLTKLQPFKERICNEVYKKHPALRIGIFVKRPFGRHIYNVRCVICGQLRLLEKKALQELIDNFRAEGKAIGLLFPFDLNEKDV